MSFTVALILLLLSIPVYGENESDTKIYDIGKKNSFGHLDERSPESQTASFMYKGIANINGNELIIEYGRREAEKQCKKFNEKNVGETEAGGDGNGMGKFEKKNGHVNIFMKLIETFCHKEVSNDKKFQILKEVFEGEYEEILDEMKNAEGKKEFNDKLVAENLTIIDMKLNIKKVFLAMKMNLELFKREKVELLPFLQSSMGYIGKFAFTDSMPLPSEIFAKLMKPLATHILKMGRNILPIKADHNGKHSEIRLKRWARPRRDLKRLIFKQYRFLARALSILALIFIRIYHAIVVEGVSPQDLPELVIFHLLTYLAHVLKGNNRLY